MSLRTISLVVVVGLAIAGCGAPARSDEPTTAKEKQRREAAATGSAQPTAKWGGWRYTGERNECFFVVGRKCFKAEQAACAAARCGKNKCDVVGGGPAAVSCAK